MRHGAGVTARACGGALRAHRGRPATSTSNPNAGSRRIRTVERSAAGLLGMARRGTGSVGERERRRRREREHRRAVVAMVGHDHRDRRGAVGDDRVERAREGKIGVDDGIARQRTTDRPGPPGGGGGVERTGVVEHCRTSRSRAQATTSGALDTTSTGREPAASTTHSAIDRASVSRSSSESVSASRALPKVNDRSGTTIPASSWDPLGIRCVCYRPWTRCILPRRRCSGPGCASACVGRSKARRTSRRTARRSSRAITSRISTRSRSPGWPNQRKRRIRFLAKAELFRNPALGVLLRAAHQIPVYRGTADSVGRALGRGRGVAEGRMRRGVPRGHDLRGPRADAGQVGNGSPRAGSGVPVVPVGLWGTHRLLTKGRKPHWRGASRRSRSSASRCPIGRR